MELGVDNKGGWQHTLIYMDHAATTPVSQTALEAVEPWLRNICGNPSSNHSAGRDAKNAVNTARKQVEEVINAPLDTVRFTSGGTEADNWALQSVASLYGRGHIITTSVEHHAVLRTTQHLERLGYHITYLPVDTEGRVSAGDIDRAIRPDTILVSVMAANNEVGTVFPIQDIGQVCRGRGVLFHTDAVQAVGHIPVDVQEWGVDLLSMSGHKFGAMKGIGALYVRPKMQLPPLLFGGRQERGMRAGTENVCGAVSMGAALQDRPSVAELAQLKNALLSGLRTIPGCHMNSPQAGCLPNIVNISFEDVESEALILQLAAKGICASGASACQAGSLQPSHVLTAMAIEEKWLRGSLRLSLSNQNTMDEVNTVVESVRDVVSMLRLYNRR